MAIFQLEYWREGDSYVGRLKGVPGVRSQAATLEELEQNVRKAYLAMRSAESTAPEAFESKPIVIDW